MRGIFVALVTFAIGKALGSALELSNIGWCTKQADPCCYPLIAWLFLLFFIFRTIARVAIAHPLCVLDPYAASDCHYSIDSFMVTYRLAASPIAVYFS